MRNSIFALMFMAAQTALFAQEYFPEGTKWTEIRLDTQKYDSWYSRVNNEWIPNYETIDYSVKGEYISEDGAKYKCVYTHCAEWKDSLTLLIKEEGNSVLASVLVRDYDGDNYLLSPGMAYQFNWRIGKGIFYEDILDSNSTDIVCCHCYYGIIDEIKEGNFGGARLLKYVELNGKAPEEESDNIHNIDTKGGRIIQGIGITEWSDGECLFGPIDPYSTLAQYQSFQRESYPERNYHSILVYFERNEEVLYDFWPEKRITAEMKSFRGKESPTSHAIYNLQGCRLTQKPEKGIYIQNGKKLIVNKR